MPILVAQWWACRTRDLVVVSSIPGWGEVSFRRIFTSHFCWSMWEKQNVDSEKKLCPQCEKARKHIVTDRHDMTLSVKVALNPNATNEPNSVLFNRFKFVSSTLSQTTNFRLLQSERVCRQQFQFWWKWQKVLQIGRKRCWKRRNCSWRAISPFLTVFSKDLYRGHLKTKACLGKG